MLTSAGGLGAAARCRELGISAYLTKPVGQEELRSAIGRALQSEPYENFPPLTAGSSPRRQGGPLRILLAEDNLVNQRVAVRLLEKRSHSVAIANNGLEVLERVEIQPFDLILMDVQMPGMDGFEATVAIRRKEAALGGHVPIIAMTAHAMEGDRARCLAAGMDGYVSKPIHPDRLFDAAPSHFNGSARCEVMSETAKNPDEKVQRR
jgi:two-component system sensor histidine kinase/response regulator